MMDRILNNKWSIRIIALVLAAILFVSVNADKNTDTSFRMASDTEVIQNVPVDVYYDKENLYVAGVPDKVTVTISGPRSIVQNAKAKGDFTVYADLRNSSIGEKTVKLKAKGLSKRLKVTISPETAKVNVQEKVTKKFSVDVEIGKSTVSAGYQAGTPTVKPGKVSITGAKDTIEQIAYVKATLDDNKKHKSNFTGKASIAVFDSNLNKLDVDVKPAKVNVSVPVQKVGKSVPLKVKQIGTPKNNLSITSITPEKDEVIAKGDSGALDKIDSIEVPVDVSKITADTVKEVTIPVPSGAAGVDPSTVEVKIKTSKKSSNGSNQRDRAEKGDLSKKNNYNSDTDSNSPDDSSSESTSTGKGNSEDGNMTKELSNVDVYTSALSKDLTAQMISPASGKVQVSLSGPKSTVEKMTANDISLVANLSNAKIGNYSTKIEVRDLPSKVNYKLSVSMAEFVISQNEST